MSQLSLLIGAVDVFNILSELNNKGIKKIQGGFAKNCDLEGFTFPSTLEYFSFSGTTKGKYTFSNVPNNLASSDGTSLTTLVICGTTLDNITFINDLTELTTVNLSYNYITTLEGVTSTLPNVTSLTSSYNNLASLYGIQYFTGLKTLDLSYNTTLGDTCSYDGTTYFNLKLLSDLRETNGKLTKLTLTGCTGITTDSTNSYWTTLKGLSGLTVTGP